MINLTIYIFLIVAIIQIIIWVVVFSKLIGLKNSTTTSLNPSATVIICTKDRLDNLKSNLPYIRSQRYNGLFLLLVDDFSDAAIAEYIKKLQQKERYLLYHKVNTNFDGKKQALKEAIVKTETEWILLTDDDCRPQSDMWAKSMISTAIESKSSIVLGYSPYSINDSWLSRWIHFEAWITGVQYLSYAVAGLPYMGVGRNILYKADIISPKDIEAHEDLISGDDDLTVNAIARSNNTSINLSEESFVWTTPPQSLTAYISQKRRHYSVSHRYKTIDKIAISAYTLSHIGFYLMFLVLLFTHYWLISLVVYSLRMIITSLIAHQLYKKMLSQNSIWSFPVMDFFQAFFYLFFSFTFILPKKKKW